MLIMDNLLAMQRAQAERDAKNRRIAELQNQIRALESEIRNIQSEMTKINNLIASKEREKKDEEKRLAKLKEFLAKFLKSRNIFEQDINARKKNFAVVEGFCGTVAIAKQHASHMRDYMSGGKFTKAFRHLEDVVRTSNNEINSTSSRISSLKSEIASLRQRYNSLQNRVSNCYSQVSAKNSEIQRLR
jgi:chromosome segregation ATPase